VALDLPVSKEAEDLSALRVTLVTPDVLDLLEVPATGAPVE